MKFAPERTHTCIHDDIFLSPSSAFTAVFFYPDVFFFLFFAGSLVTQRGPALRTSCLSEPPENTDGSKAVAARVWRTAARSASSFENRLSTDALLVRRCHKRRAAAAVKQQRCKPIGMAAVAESANGRADTLTTVFARVRVVCAKPKREWATGAPPGTTCFGAFSCVLLFTPRTFHSAALN